MSVSKHVTEDIPVCSVVVKVVNQTLRYITNWQNSLTNTIGLSLETYKFFLIIFSLATPVSLVIREKKNNIQTNAKYKHYANLRIVQNKALLFQLI